MKLTKDEFTLRLEQLNDLDRNEVFWLMNVLDEIDHYRTFMQDMGEKARVRSTKRLTCYRGTVEIGEMGTVQYNSDLEALVLFDNGVSVKCYSSQLELVK